MIFFFTTVHEKMHKDLKHLMYIASTQLKKLGVHFRRSLGFPNPNASKNLCPTFLSFWYCPAARQNLQLTMRSLQHARLRRLFN